MQQISDGLSESQKKLLALKKLTNTTGKIKRSIEHAFGLELTETSISATKVQKNYEDTLSM
jgi:hypothetical protein